MLPCCTVGAAATITVKVPGTEIDPVAVATLIAPEAAPGITSAVREVLERLSTIAAAPPMRTDCAVEKSAPVKVTMVPTEPDDGVKVATAGGLLGGGLELLLPPQPVSAPNVRQKTASRAPANADRAAIN